jgi:ATP-binding cassette subfamily B protein
VKNFVRMVRVASGVPGVMPRLVLSQVLVVVSSLAILVQPKLIERIINGPITDGDLEGVIGLALWMALVAVGIFVLQLGVWAAASWLAAFVAHGLRIRTFRAVLGLSPGNLDRFEPSELLVRMTADVQNAKVGVLQASAMLLQAPIVLIGAIVLVALTAPSLFPVLLGVLAVLTVIVVVYGSRLRPLQRAMQERLDDTNLVMEENLSGVRVVKAFVGMQREIARFDDRNLALETAAMRPARWTAVLVPTFFFMVNVGTAIGLAVAGGSRGTDSPISSGELIAFNNYLLAAMFPMFVLAIVLPNVSLADASLGRIYEVLDDVADIADTATSDPLPAEITGRVVFEGVELTYRLPDGSYAATPALTGIDLVAEPGTITAILGATGSGKTTLVNLLPRFYDPTAGRITIDGVDVRDIPLARLRSIVGIALQRAILFSGTVAENIALGDPDLEADDLATYLRASDSATFVDALPDQERSPVAREGANFSGGQRQRLSIARALARRPRFLILDDSTSAVDVATETRIQAELAELTKGVTTFIVAQRISTVLIADAIVVLDGGRIVARGSHAELLASSELYREIYESQLGSIEEAAAVIGHA